MSKRKRVDGAPMQARAAQESGAPTRGARTGASVKNMGEWFGKGRERQGRDGADVGFVAVSRGGYSSGFAEASADRRGEGHPQGAPLQVRRWDAAETNSHNEGHWTGVTGVTINEDLAGRLDVLRNRAQHEIANNPMLEGVVGTYSADLVGPTGPQLVVDSGNKEYDRAFEERWREWWMCPDYQGRLDGASMLRLGADQLWGSGEFLWEFVTDKEAADKSGGVALRLLMVDARLVSNPNTSVDWENMVIGVELDDKGKPKQFHVEDRGGAGYSYFSKYRSVSADKMVHYFVPSEPNQARGFPWVASALSTIADLREYDTHVLDSAKFAAAQTVLLYSDHPDIEPMVVEEGDQQDLYRNTMTTLPPGWKATGLEPTQPTANYVDFRTERLRELGRKVGMPLIITKQDASRSNYSSARFDGLGYDRMLKTRREEINLRVMNKTVLEWQKEAEMMDGFLPARPKGKSVKFKWIWPIRPAVDMQKEMAAVKEKLVTMMDSPRSLAMQVTGRPFEDIVKEYKEDLAACAGAGVDFIGMLTGGSVGEEGDDDGGGGKKW